jgi:hypothetical protein
MKNKGLKRAYSENYNDQILKKTILSSLLLCAWWRFKNDPINILQ